MPLHETLYIPLSACQGGGGLTGGCSATLHSPATRDCGRMTTTPYGQ